jgi:hypothetical protein
MSLFTRDDARYWTDRPADHSVAGLFVHGPHESRPSVFRDVETGEAHRSEEPPAQVRARQQYERTQRQARINRGSGFVQAVISGRIRPFVRG